MSDYCVQATSRTPALVIYVIDVSAEMGKQFGSTTRIARMNELLEGTFGSMILRSQRGMRIGARFDVSVIAYSDSAEMVLPNDVMSIDRLAQLGSPEFVANGARDTADALRIALDLLRRELPQRLDHPPPCVCHLIGGEYTGRDPWPFAREIMTLCTRDGAVLLENIFIAEGLTLAGVTAETWEGLRTEDEVRDPFARELFRMSSVMPEPIRRAVSDEIPSALREGVRMLFPAGEVELLELGLATSSNSGRGLQPSRRPPR